MTAPVPFMPSPASGQTVTAGAAAEITSLSLADSQVSITNLDATAVAYVRIAPAGNATAADYPIPAATTRVLTKGPSATRLSYYSAGTPALHISTGNGWHSGS